MSALNNTEKQPLIVYEEKTHNLPVEKELIAERTSSLAPNNVALKSKMSPSIVDILTNNHNTSRKVATLSPNQNVNINLSRKILKSGPMLVKMAESPTSSSPLKMYFKKLASPKVS